MTGLDRPLGLQEAAAPRISRQSALTTFSPKRYPWYLFLLEAQSTPGPYGGWKD